jgi:Tfp pilus assembly protein PilP
MSELHTWQRRHRNGYVAEVSPVPGMGSWEASTYTATGRSGPIEDRFSLLTDAQGAADRLALVLAPHDCSRCGVWVAVERLLTTRTRRRSA